MDQFKGPEGPTGPRGKRGPVEAPGGFIQTKGGLLLPNGAVTIRHGTGGHLFLDAIPAGQQAEIWFHDGGVAKWAIYKDAANNLAFYSVTVGNTFVQNVATGATTLPLLAGSGARRVEASAAGVISATAQPDRDLIYDSGLVGPVSELIVPSVFSATYREYDVEVTEILLTAAANVYLRLRSGVTPASGADYWYHLYEGYSTVAGPIGTIQVAGAAHQVHANSGIIMDHGTLQARISLPFVATQTTFSAKLAGRWAATPGAFWSISGGHHNLATSYDGFSVFLSSGNISGRAKVYGVR